MCGIAGHVVSGGAPAQREAVSSASRLLRHRGPDSSGQVDLPGCSLAHRRLSIIDIEGSRQPWVSACGRYHMVFNGEIYNYLELRGELVKRGHRFTSSGDTEVLLSLYIEYGPSCLERLNGMFAFAVWDTREQSLFLARDRLGKKPLYYAASGGEMAFASELQALAPFRFVDRSINPEAVEDFFAHQFIGEQRTIYRGVRKLPPGSCLFWRGGESTISRYWLPPLPQEGAGDTDALCEEFRALLSDAVRLRMRSDVPAGAFLSGGIDSSLVVASLKQSGFDVEAFTVGFREGSYDESGLAAEVATALDCRHVTHCVALEQVERIDRVIAAFGEPFADPSALPTWELSRFTREHVTVALSGDGVDELFGGYRRYYARYLLQCAGISPRVLGNGLIQRLLDLFPEPTRYYGTSLVKKLRLVHALGRQQRENPGDPLPRLFGPRELRQLLGHGGGKWDHVGSYGLEDLDAVSRMMALDQRIYLPDDILVKVDRMSMRHSLEVRCPFLDHRLVEFAARLPLDCKIRRGVQKYLVRRCARGLLPQKVLRRGKHGFAVPLGDWFRGVLRPRFEEAVMGSDGSGLLCREMVSRLWHEHQQGRRDHGFRLWSIYVFERWWSMQRELR